MHGRQNRLTYFIREPVYMYGENLLIADYVRQLSLASASKHLFIAPWNKGAGSSLAQVFVDHLSRVLIIAQPNKP